MATPSRSTLLTKVHKVLKKHYKPVAPEAERTVLQQLLFACCLENSPPAAAQQAYANLIEQFFDWNEVRVSTLRELAEVVQPLNDPQDAAMRIKKCLQSIFESQYSFDLDALRKQNLGQAVKTLKGYKGTTPFVIGYVVQAALGGHSIPVNGGGLQAFEIVGVITPAEASKQAVPGMERAISKTKGVEFASLIHQIGVDLAASPYGPGPRKILLEIDPGCKDRLPKRPSKSKPKPEPEAVPPAKPSKAEKSSAAKPTAAKASSKGKTAKAAKKKAAPTKKAAKKKTSRPATAARKKTKAKKKGSSSKSLTRRKPR